MTAKGKVTANGLRVGDVVLLERSTLAETWIPAVRKGDTTVAIKVTYLGRTMGGGRSRVTLDYQFLAQEHTHHMDVSPSQTFWLASASRVWARVLADRGIAVER